MDAGRTRRGPLLLTDGDVEVIFDLTAGGLQGWIDKGGMGPEPIMLAGQRYWLPTDIRAWIEARCPNHSTWMNRDKLKVGVLE